MKIKVNNILLYILCIPAGILVTMIIGFVFDLFNVSGNFFSPIIKGALMGFIGVYTVGYLSPKYKIELVLTYAIITIVVFTYGFFIRNVEITLIHKIEIITQVLSTLVFLIMIKIDGTNRLFNNPFSRQHN